jgi:hypothetical protein
MDHCRGTSGLGERAERWPHRRRFTDTSLDGANVNWGLDAVTVDVAPAGGVPESTSLTLLAGALIAIGAGYRHRARG